MLSHRNLKPLFIKGFVVSGVLYCLVISSLILTSDVHCQVYRELKVWQQLNSEGIHPACCTVERLMRQHGMQGIWRSKGVIASVGTTGDLLEHSSRLVKPNRYVTDF